MRHMMTAAVAVALMTCQAAAQLSIQVQSFPPGQEVKPGVAVILILSGLQEGQEAVWHHGQIEGDLVLDFGSSKHRLFAGTKPGPRTFVVQVPSAGADPFTVCQFQYGGKEDPDPDPLPIPGPKLLLIIEESDPENRTPELGNLLDRLRHDADDGWLSKQGHTLLTLDQNSNDPIVKKTLKPDDVLPMLVLFREGRKLWWGPLPSKFDAVLQVVKVH